MESFLFSEEIEFRYDTMLKEIEILSPSFFDSYLDLLEETIKYILRDNKIKFDRKKTCGYLIKDKNIHHFFEEILGCSSFGCSTETLQECIKTCNLHKHDKPRSLDFEMMSNLLQSYFNLVNCYSIFLFHPQISFDVNYFYELYGKSEKLDLSQRETINRQKETIERQKTIIEEQNKQLKEHISAYNARPKKAMPVKEQKKNVLLSFLTSSKKEDLWWGPVDEWRKSKKIYIVSLCCILIIGLLVTIVSSLSFGLYSTFTLLENIWMIVVVVVLKNAIKTKKVLPNDEYRRLSIDKFEMDNVGYYHSTNCMKKWIKAFRIIGIISSLLNICYSFIVNSPNKGWIILLEALFVLSSISIIFSASNFYAMYSQFVLFKGKGPILDKETVLVGEVMTGKIMTYDEFVKKTGGIDLEKFS